MLVHFGYQRLLQYGHVDACTGCSVKFECAGIHKRYRRDWQVSPI
jgi:hypothetical protein